MGVEPLTLRSRPTYKLRPEPLGHTADFELFSKSECKRTLFAAGEGEADSSLAAQKTNSVLHQSKMSVITVKY